MYDEAMLGSELCVEGWLVGWVGAHACRLMNCGSGRAAGQAQGLVILDSTGLGEIQMADKQGSQPASRVRAATGNLFRFKTREGIKSNGFGQFPLLW